MSTPSRAATSRAEVDIYLGRRQIGDFALSVLPETGPDSTCLDVLNYSQQGRSHILLVSRVSPALSRSTLRDLWGS